MDTLSLFPGLLSFGFFAPLLLRIVVGLFVIHLGLKRYKNQYNWTSFLYVLSGVMLILGLYTQAFSIVGIGVLKFDFYFDFYKNRAITPISKEKYFLYVMAMIILLSLLLTGPGAIAFDLPL